MPDVHALKCFNSHRSIALGYRTQIRIRRFISVVPRICVAAGSRRELSDRQNAKSPISSFRPIKGFSASYDYTAGR